MRLDMKSFIKEYLEIQLTQRVKCIECACNSFSQSIFSYNDNPSSMLLWSKISVDLFIVVLFQFNHN